LLKIIRTSPPSNDLVFETAHVLRMQQTAIARMLHFQTDKSFVNEVTSPNVRSRAPNQVRQI